MNDYLEVRLVYHTFNADSKEFTFSTQTSFTKLGIDNCQSFLDVLGYTVTTKWVELAKVVGLIK